ncbi:zinc-binding dehydrogenase [Ensifer canadensis]
MHALVFDTFGGPEVLSYREVADPAVPPGHIQLAMRAIGLNFADIYRRKGNYVLAGKAPFIAGYEGAGEVVAVGEDVEGVAIGDRIGFADVPFANATRVTVPLERAIPLPVDIDFEAAAALLLQGLTAQYLVEDSYSIRAGDTVLVQAAGGGVGQLLIRLAIARGASVIAMASTAEKQALATAAGSVHALGYDEGWPDKVRALSAGGVNVAYDSVGVTLLDSLAAVRSRGTLVTFGMAGGAGTAGRSALPHGKLENRRRWRSLGFSHRSAATVEPGRAAVPGAARGYYPAAAHRDLRALGRGSRPCPARRSPLLRQDRAFARMTPVLFSRPRQATGTL